MDRTELSREIESLVRKVASAPKPAVIGLADAYDDGSGVEVSLETSTARLSLNLGYQYSGVVGLNVWWELKGVRAWFLSEGALEFWSDDPIRWACARRILADLGYVPISVRGGRRSFEWWELVVGGWTADGGGMRLRGEWRQEELIPSW